MSREATVGCGLKIRVGNIDSRMYPVQFTADVSEESGPSPGDVLIGTHGYDVDLSNISTPGLCWIQNRSDIGYIVVGINDGSRFYPMLELLPGEAYTMRLFRSLGAEFQGSGTGTPSDTNLLHIRAIGDDNVSSVTARVYIGAFGK